MPFNDYVGLLARDATLVQVGLPEDKIPFALGGLVGARRKVTGSAIGSPNDIREMLALSAEKGVKPWVQVRPMSEANQALIDFEDGKPRFRYVLVNE